MEIHGPAADPVLLDNLRNSRMRVLITLHIFLFRTTCPQRFLRAGASGVHDKTLFGRKQTIETQKP
jgi:hypothetical protein